MYHLTFAKDDLEKVIEIESDRFQNLELREAGVSDRGRRGLRRVSHRRHPAVRSLLHEKLQDLAYDVHTYKHTTIGFEADIKAMPEAYEYSLDFYRRFYRPDNVVLLIAGDVDPTATLGLIEKYYGPWEKGYEPPKIPPSRRKPRERTAEVPFPGRTLPILVVAYKGDAFDPANRDYVAARLLGELAFGPQSELVQEARPATSRRSRCSRATFPMNRDQPLFDIVRDGQEGGGR